MIFAQQKYKVYQFDILNKKKYTRAKLHIVLKK